MKKSDRKKIMNHFEKQLEEIKEKKKKYFKTFILLILVSILTIIEPLFSISFFIYLNIICVVKFIKLIDKEKKIRWLIG